MEKIRVLLADNSPLALITWGEELTRAGYQLLTAGSPEEARHVLDEQWIDVAVLDWRLEDDSPVDDSGYELACDARCADIAVIMLTGWPTWEDVRTVRTPGPNGRPPAVDFVSKAEEMDVFLAAVAGALERHAAADWNLAIAAHARRHLINLTNHLMPAVADDKMLDYVHELEVLLRRLFHQDKGQPAYNQIAIDRVLWERPDRVALAVYAYPKDTVRRREFLVVCGVAAAVERERAAVSLHARELPRPGSAHLARQATTRHFAANAYELPEADLEAIRPLRDFYRQNGAAPVAAMLEQLAATGLRAWHTPGRIGRAGESVDALLRARFGLPERAELAGALEGRLRALAVEAADEGVARLDLEGDGMTLFLLPDDRRYPLANPAGWLRRPAPAGEPTLIGLTLGAPEADTILVDSARPPGGLPPGQPADRAWLTDFGAVDEGPVLADFAALEAAIKFDADEIAHLPDFHELEGELLAANGLADRLPGASSRLRKAMGAAGRVRAAAHEAVGDGIETYYRALFYAAAARLLRYPPEAARSRRDLQVMIFLCLSLGKLAARLAVETAREPDETPRLEIHPVTGEVTLGRRLIEIKSQEQYNLLRYLWEQDGRVCSRDELYRHLYGRAYTPDDEDQFNMLILRLRQTLGEGKSPRYLVNRPGQGYVLYRGGRPRPK